MAQTLETIREKVRQHKGVEVCYKATNGRRKMEERNGVIQDVYPSLFTLYIESQRSLISFSYADLLTHEVEMQLTSNGEYLF